MGLEKHVGRSVKRPFHDEISIRQGAVSGIKRFSSDALRCSYYAPFFWQILVAAELHRYQKSARD